MNRTEKKELIEGLNKSIAGSSIVLVAHYKGLTVAEITDLRVKIRNIGAGFKVTKNKLTQLALAGTQFEQISAMFVGPTAIAYSSDPVAIAKVLSEFAKANEKLVMLGGAFGGQPFFAAGHGDDAGLDHFGDAELGEHGDEGVDLALLASELDDHGV